MSKRSYEGERITVYFDGNRCIHSRNCVLHRPDVFIANGGKDWIQPDNANVELLAGVIRTCPSGALTYERTDGGVEEEVPQVNTIRVQEDGPLAVRADIELDGQQVAYRATLCRCGASGRKPFCDGSHEKIAFSATGDPEPQESEPLENRGGPLKITPTKDGPFSVEGNVEIVAGTGKTIDRTQETALCRCGHSGNKPFCDGSHQKVGFKSDE